MTPTDTRPWYRHPMLWVVITPPLAAVLAGAVTMALILMHPDPDVRTPHFVALARPAATAAAVPHASNSVVPPVD